jgi:hypothetical protein
MAEHSIVRLAKQGDPKAIAYLITRSLKKYGITARAARKQSSLKLLLEAEQLPHQATMVRLVEQGMHKLNPTGLDLVKIYGRKRTEPEPAWRYVLELVPPVSAANAFPAADPTDPARRDPTEESLSEEAAAQIFRLDDLDPDAMILLPIDSQVQIADLDPDALILFPLEPVPADGFQEQTPASAVDLSALPPENGFAAESGAELLEHQLAAQNANHSLQSPYQADQNGTDADAQLGNQLGTQQSNQPSDLPTGLANQPIDPLGYSAAHLPELAQPPKRLPRGLTQLLLGLLWVALLINSLGLIYALLSAGSFSLYAGLDLSNTNLPFAGLLAAVVSIANFVVSPFSRANLWIGLVALVLVAIWLYRIHASLRNLLPDYPISPTGAVVRFAVPGLNLWGWASLITTLARRLAQTLLANLNPLSSVLRQLTVWLYGTLFALLLLTLLASLAFQSLLLELIDQFAPTVTLLVLPLVTPVFDFMLTSPWYEVVRSAALWLVSLVVLRLVRNIWRAVRRLYQAQMAPFLPAKPARAARKPASFSLRAILLGSGASLLSLALFTCLLGLIAALVFVSNGVRPEAIVPTFYDSESLLILVLLGSLLSVGLGGFLASHLAHQRYWLHALGLGVFLTVIGLILQRSLLVATLTDLPFWFQTASTALIIPAALIGSGLCRWLKSLN